MVDNSRPVVTGCLVKLLLVLLGAVMGTVLTAIAAVILFLPSRNTLHATPAAGDHPGVCVKEVDRLIGRTEYEVWLGRTDNRGHVVPVPAGWGSDPQADFAADSVRLRFSNGGEISVPKSDYQDTR
jgi:hypothetical protein